MDWNNTSVQGLLGSLWWRLHSLFPSLSVGWKVRKIKQGAAEISLSLSKLSFSPPVLSKTYSFVVSLLKKSFAHPFHTQLLPLENGEE